MRDFRRWLTTEDRSESASLFDGIKAYYGMNQTTLRTASPDDFNAIVALNDVEVKQTSPMDVERLRDLSAMATYHKVAVVDSRIAAFLLAMREGAPYQNDNYGWFATRFTRFLYVDRIVVSADSAGYGIGSKLYEDLFDYARSQGVTAVTCEYNLQPPNPASQRFHDKFGFKEIGTQWVANKTKLVSLQAAVV